MSPEMRAALQTLGLQTDAVPRQTQPLSGMDANTEEAERASTGSLALGASASTLGVSLTPPIPDVGKAGMQSVVEKRAVTAAAKSMMDQAVAKAALSAESNANIRTAAEQAQEALRAEGSNELSRVFGMSLLQATERMRGSYDAGIRRIGLKDIPVSAGGSGGNLTTADIDETFSKIGLQHVAPVLGVPADLLCIDDVRTQQSTWPSYVLGRRSWAENLHFPLADYEIRKAGEVYGARVPAGTLLNPLQHS